MTDTRREQTRTVEVPQNTGVQGYLTAIEQIIAQPRVQRVVLESNGRVTYTRLVSDDDDVAPHNVDFEHVLPYAIIRQVEIVEESFPISYTACAVVAGLVDKACVAGYYPICFVTGVHSQLWEWLRVRSGLTISVTELLYGYQVYRDQEVPDEVLILCAGNKGAHAVIDTRIAIKVVMYCGSVLDDAVEVF